MNDGNGLLRKTRSDETEMRVVFAEFGNREYLLKVPPGGKLQAPQSPPGIPSGGSESRNPLGLLLIYWLGAAHPLLQSPKKSLNRIHRRYFQWWPANAF
jgi:hypothetical protein